VSAPFRALGRLFGGVDEEVASIEFTPGSARLRPPEREKLDKVAHVLSERRELTLIRK
jgi:outer membrane protein OmpA-like peptidoglycan-associated protein